MQNVTTIGALTVNQMAIGNHSHNLWELVYYTEGSGQVVIGDVQHSFSANDFVIVPPGLVHRDWSDGNFSVIFSSFHSFQLPSKQDFPLFHDNENLLILDMMRQLQYVYLQQSADWNMLADALQNVISQYVHHYTPPVTRDPVIEEIESRIVAKLSNADFNINDALEGFGRNKIYLRDLFTKENGISPLQFLTHRRIELAKQMLISSDSTNFTIRYIARLCGFTDPYYFSRVFKKETGTSPKAWLEAAQKKD